MVAITNVKKLKHWLTNAMLHATNAMLHTTNAMLPATNAMLQATNAICTKVKTNKVKTNKTPLPHWFIVSMGVGSTHDDLSLPTLVTQ